MKYGFIILALIKCLVVFGADYKFPVSTIPAELKEKVDVVIRVEESVFKILSKNEAKYYVHEVYTILNEKGTRYAKKVVGYDKLTKINSFSAIAYDATGKQIEKLKNSEFYDQSSFDGFSLYSDNRLKMADVAQSTYPYTVEFEYELEFKYLFFIPSYEQLSAERVSVEKSSYSLVYPKELEPRYSTQNIDSKPKQIKTSDGLESLVWNFANIKPMKFEPQGPLREELISRIAAAPNHFSYEGYEGNMNSWVQFGLWIKSLSIGRDILPQETVQKIKQLTASLSTREDKVRVIYQYLQSKTRYVSIQLGIGGHQPFEAQLVDKTGYGDCKALSNYMVAMLEAVGIGANYTLIKAGEGEMDLNIDFPSSQFNHVIVAVPNGTDTLWLECTSQTNPFGYLGKFTGDRHALMITNEGGKVVKTPVYKSEQNLQSRIATVILDKSGNANATVRTTYTGLQYENDDLNVIAERGQDDQKRWIQSNTQIPSFDVASFTITNQKNKIPSAEVKVNLILNRFATVSGKRLFFTPNLMNRTTYIPEMLETRKTKVVRRMAYFDIDSIHYVLPEEIYPEFIPDRIIIKSRFGEYESSYKLEQGNLIYVRRVKMNKGDFPPDSYKELIDFYKNISKADNAKMAFMNKT